NPTIFADRAQLSEKLRSTAPRRVVRELKSIRKGGNWIVGRFVSPHPDPLPGERECRAPMLKLALQKRLFARLAKCRPRQPVSRGPPVPPRSGRHARRRSTPATRPRTR